MPTLQPWLRLNTPAYCEAHQPQAIRCSLPANPTMAFLGTPAPAALQETHKAVPLPMRAGTFSFQGSCFWVIRLRVPSLTSTLPGLAPQYCQTPRKSNWQPAKVVPLVSSVLNLAPHFALLQATGPHKQTPLTLCTESFDPAYRREASKPPCVGCLLFAYCRQAHPWVSNNSSSSSSMQSGCPAINLPRI